MKTASLTNRIEHHERFPVLQVLMNTETGREIRITFKKDQVMEEHQTPFPIVVEVFEGSIAFGVQGNIQTLQRGDLVTLGGNIPHALKAIQESVVRLSINKTNAAEQVQDQR
ncbi:MAG: cupin [Christiangramia sp.]|uniref:cupin n=1 Tax=Christiangramia sp. TaxID=1931228 RepID=UPI003242D910